MLLNIAKLLWYLSFPLFLGLAIYIYIYLPNTVLFGDQIELSVTKTVFFYSLVGVMLFANFAFNLIGNLVAYFPAPFLLVPKKAQWTETIKARKKLAVQLKNWFRGILLLFNIFLILFGASIYVLNTPETIINVQAYFYVVAVFLIVWLIYYPFALSDAPES